MCVCVYKLEGPSVNGYLQGRVRRERAFAQLMGAGVPTSLCQKGEGERQEGGVLCRSFFFCLVPAGVDDRSGEGEKKRQRDGEIV